MRAVRITEKNIEWMGLIGNGVKLSPNCLDRVTYIVDQQDPTIYSSHFLMTQDMFRQVYAFVDGELEDVLVPIKQVGPEPRWMVRMHKRSRILTAKRKARKKNAKKYAKKNGKKK